MGSPTSDDDPTQRVPGSGDRSPGGPPSYPPPGQGQQGTPPYPPAGQGGGYGQGSPTPDQETTRFAQPPGEGQRGQTAQFPPVGGGGPYPQGQGGQYPQGPYGQGPGGQYAQGPGGQYPQGPGAAYPQGPYGQGPGGQYGQGPGAPYGQGPGGPYPPQGPYGGPPPGSGRSRRGLIIALVAGLVVLAGIAVALVIAFTRDDGETVSADPTAATSEPPASTSAEPSPTESTPAEPSPTETGGDRTGELLAAVPADFTDCEGTGLAGDGDVAAVRCGASTTQPGPQSAFFYLYEDTQALDEVFVRDAEGLGLEELPDNETCATSQGITVWNVGGVEGGNVACAITEDGLLIAWTDREFGIEGVVRAPGTTQEELAELADWWTANSDFQR